MRNERAALEKRELNYGHSFLFLVYGNHHHFARNYHGAFHFGRSFVEKDGAQVAVLVEYQWVFDIDATLSMDIV